MDPRLIGPEEWTQLGRALTSLVVFAVLAINMALAFLVAHAIIPSLAETRDLPSGLEGLRRLLYPISALSLVAAGYALGRSLYLFVGVIQQVYPRFAL